MFQAGAVTTGCLLFLQFVPKQPRDTSHFEDPQLAEPSNLKLSSMPQSPRNPQLPTPVPATETLRGRLPFCCVLLCARGLAPVERVEVLWSSRFFGFRVQSPSEWEVSGFTGCFRQSATASVVSERG